MNIQQKFEDWYCETYWDFRSLINRAVFYDNRSDSYNHFDVDLAYNAFKAGGAQ